MQRLATRQSRGINSAEKRHLVWVKENRVCAATNQQCFNVIAHHCEGSSFKHNKVLIGHWFIIGLCHEADEIITLRSRRAFREIYGAQSELWLKQFESYPYKNECPREIIDAITSYRK